MIGFLCIHILLFFFASHLGIFYVVLFFVHVCVYLCLDIKHQIEGKKRHWNLIASNIKAVQINSSALYSSFSPFSFCFVAEEFSNLFRFEQESSASNNVQLISPFNWDHYNSKVELSFKHKSGGGIKLNKWI